MTFATLLTVLFIALKLTGVIAWPWLWVLAPTLAEAAFIFLFIVFAAVFGAKR